MAPPSMSSPGQFMFSFGGTTDQKQPKPFTNVPEQHSPPSMNNLFSNMPLSTGQRLTEAHKVDGDVEASRLLAIAGIDNHNSTTGSADEEMLTCPMFSLHAGRVFGRKHFSMSIAFKQFGLLSARIDDPLIPHDNADKLLFLNTNAPWSAFLCGSQGSGKSYTLSCMLENCLLKGRMEEHGIQLTSPSCAMVFHYDSHASDMICETAYLSSHVPVKILCTASSFLRLKKVYEAKLGIGSKFKIFPLLLRGEHLNAERLLRLMGFENEKGVAPPLYMQAIVEIIRNMSLRSGLDNGIDYVQFLRDVEDRAFTPTQLAPLSLRRTLLDGLIQETFHEMKVAEELSTAANTSGDVFAAEPGTVTIVDLSDPMIDASTACNLFDMCLSIFKEKTKGHSKVFALDEAHKFMTETDASSRFTESLKTLIREQRHLGARAIISTQEPNISPSLLELCSLTLVHRFTSPAWFQVLRQHLAAAANMRGDAAESADALFEEIIQLRAGQSLLFAPSAMTEVSGEEVKPLQRGYLKMKTRKRITVDGGRSFMGNESVGVKEGGMKFGVVGVVNGVNGVNGVRKSD